MLYDYFTTLRSMRRWLMAAYVCFAGAITLTPFCDYVVYMPTWVLGADIALLWCILYLAAINFRWLKKHWVTYEQNGVCYVVEDTQDIHTFPEPQDDFSCLVQYGEPDESDVMTS